MIQGGVGDSHDPPQAQENLFVDLIATDEIFVVAELPQEPAEPPQSLLGAIEAASEKAALILVWLEDGEAEDVERSLRMPAEENTINSDRSPGAKGRKSSSS
jgi:hypothetical protein